MSDVITATKTKLFNDDLREIVELSMDTESVKSIKGIHYSETLGLYVIDGDTFSKLRDNFGDAYRDYQEISAEHFVETCNKMETYYNLSDTGYARIYGEFVDAGDDIEQIFRGLPQILMGYRERTPEDVLSLSDMSTEEIEALEDKRLAAIEYIMSNDYMSYIDEYEVNGELVFFYSES